MERITSINKTAIEEVLSIAEKVEAMTGEEKVVAARGLTRTRLVSRSATGLPITHEGLLLAEMMRQNEQRAEGERV